MSSPAVILCHLGEVPNHLHDCIQQIRDWSDINVIVVADNYVSTVQDVTVVATHRLNTNSIVQRMRALPFKQHEPNPLWHTAALRFAYIAAAAMLFDVSGVIHFDNDVLIYKDPLELLPILRKGKGIAITPCNDELLICGFVYVRDWPIMCFLADQLANKMEIVDDNEMRLLRLVAEDYPNSFDMLPLMPSCEHYHRFGGVFDCASWGQWIGGTHQNPGVAWAGNHHYIGAAINRGMYTVIWRPDGSGRYIPICNSYDGEETPIFNLHIHSKELYKYVS